MYFSLNGMKLEINNNRKLGTFTIMRPLQSNSLNNQLAQEKITKEIRKYSEIN